MSGHNKWSKIKRKKAVTDAEKSAVFAKHATNITMAVRQAGGAITSGSVTAAIERAKKDSMPKENIERAIMKGTGVNASVYEEIIFEAFGPGGTGMIIRAITDNNNRTAPEIKHIFAKHGFQIGPPGTAVWAFSKTNDGYSPLQASTISEDELSALEDLVDALSNHTDVQAVYTTADQPDEYESPRD
jgi:YebC/PmpR family DNA-binding regulatory protein